MIEHRRGYLTAENLPATVRRFKRENEPMTFNIGTSLPELQREATLKVAGDGNGHPFWDDLIGIVSTRR